MIFFLSIVIVALLAGLFILTKKNKKFRWEEIAPILHTKGEEHLQAILKGMREGVVIVDAQAKIQWVNPAFLQMIAVPEPPEGRTLLECIRSRELDDCLKKTLNTKACQELKLTFQGRNKELILTLHTIPLKSQEKQEGAALIFYDITQVEELKKMREEFVANVSHELKTPLTNILGYAETLKMGALEERTAASDFVAKIERNAWQLKNLVDDLLKLSEVEQSRGEFHPISLDLTEAFSELHGDFHHRLDSKKISFRQEIQKPLYLLADPEALHKMLANLLDNAVKYTPEGGVIVIRATVLGTHCEIAVKDTGVGIPKKDLPHIFERFYRVDKARSRELGGTGLGLAIVKHLSQAQGGDVRVESELERGSQFYLTLPLAGPPQK